MALVTWDQDPKSRHKTSIFGIFFHVDSKLTSDVFPIDSTLDPLFMKEIEVAIKFDLAFFPWNITLNSKGANVGLGYKIRAF